MSENLRKLIGVVVMAVLVVVGVFLSSDDDGDFSRNRSISSAADRSVGADPAEIADCCDETLALLASMQDDHAKTLESIQDLRAEIRDVFNQGARAAVGAKPNLETIGWRLTQVCPPPHWPTAGIFLTHIELREAADCVVSYIDGYPLDAAREVVRHHGYFKFVHLFDADLLSSPHPHHHYELSDEEVTAFYKEGLTEEACHPYYGMAGSSSLGFGKRLQWGYLATIGISSEDGFVSKNFWWSSRSSYDKFPSRYYFPNPSWVKNWEQQSSYKLNTWYGAEFVSPPYGIAWLSDAEARGFCQ